MLIYFAQILRSEELRSEAGREADKQLQGYGFLQFSDDGIHRGHVKKPDASNLTTASTESAAHVRMGRKSAAHAQLGREGNFRFIPEQKLDAAASGSPKRTPSIEWNGHGIPRFESP